MTETHLFLGGSCIPKFRRNENDRRPPREVVTGRLMGDPKATRDADAEAIRRRIMAKVVASTPVTVVGLLQALLASPMGATEVCRLLDCSPSAASDRAKRARALGCLEMREHRSNGGRKKVYYVTDAGREFLEAQS
jgi:hypothetical protein